MAQAMSVMLLKRLALGLLVLGMSGGALHAAGGAVELKTDGQCSYGGETLPKVVYTFTSDNEAEGVVDNIVEHTGLRRNFEISASDVPNAAAITMGSVRYLLYSQTFMEDVKQKTNSYWAGISIMAHEIGHHLQGHTLDNEGSRPTKEIEADEYSGFVLQKMGATLEQAQAAMKAIASDTGSSTHPAKASRLAAIRAGWTKAKEQGGTSSSSAPPVAAPTPATPASTATVSGKYSINGDGTVTDTKTGLMWKQCSEGQSGKDCSIGKAEDYKWDDAMSKFRSGVSFAGHSDWRMPTQQELHTLVYCSNGTPQEVAWHDNKCGGKDAKRGEYRQPTINQMVFPNTAIAWYWSSTRKDENSYFINFSYGSLLYASSSGYNYWTNRGNASAVRLVRSGQ